MGEGCQVHKIIQILSVSESVHVIPPSLQREQALSAEGFILSFIFYMHTSVGYLNQILLYS